MISDRKALALVPARGGSKGLPGKNLRPLCGRPLIQWSIDTALSCQEISAVVVSTDSEAIAEVAAAAGAEVPFLRPSALADDTASSIDVVIHALDFLEAKGRVFDTVLLLEPTSPLREPVDVQLSLQRMIDEEADAVVSVSRAESMHPAFMFRNNERGRLEPFLSASPTGLRRQELEPLFYLDGTIYASTVLALRRRRTFFHEDTLAYEVAKWKALEIDDLEDFEMVEAIAEYRKLA